MGPVVVVGDTSPAIENTVSPAVETSAPARADAVVSSSTSRRRLPRRFAAWGGEEVFSVKSVPCSEPHSEEIYATVTLPDGDFPGEEVAGSRQTSRALRSLRASSDCPTRNRLSISAI